MRNIRVELNAGRPIFWMVCLAVVSVGFHACKSSQSSVDSNTKVEAPAEDDTYLLVVSFFSPGNGIDRDMKKKFEEYIASDYPALTYDKTAWGREGEVDFCIKGSQLSKSEKAAFVSGSKELLVSSSKVRISENAECKRKKN